MGSVSQIGVIADESTLTKTGNVLSVKDGGITNQQLANAVPSVHELYTGTAWDNGGSYETSVISAATLSSSNYIRVTINFKGTWTIDGINASSCSIKGQIKEVGGVYSDITSAVLVLGNNSGGNSNNVTRYNGGCLTLLASVTSGMKNNGAQIKIVSTKGANGTIQNVQTIIEVW